jgi:hypothetical protein
MRHHTARSDRPRKPLLPDAAKPLGRAQAARTPLVFAASLALVTGLAACGSAPAQSEAPSGEETQHSSSMDENATATVTSTGDPFADARTAAQHMPATAATLAAGFVEALDIPGEGDSPAADLRAGLTALLQEHVYLAGYSVAAAYTAGPESDEFTAAAATLDENTKDLVAAVESIAGPEKAEQFGGLWRSHIGFFVDYAVAVKSGDDAAAQQAQDALAGYTAGAGRFFEEVSGGQLPASAVSAALTMHVTTLSAAIDDLAAGSPEASGSLQAAAAHVVESAAVLSAGLAAAGGLEGSTDDEATSLRVGLTALLQEHVYLAGLAVFTAYTTDGGTESEQFSAAAATLDANSVALADAVGSLAGEEKGQEFLELWRSHIGFFVDFAVAQATDDDAAADQALAALDGYRGAAGRFFDEVSKGELPADAVADELAEHVRTLGGAIVSLRTALVPES